MADVAEPTLLKKSAYAKHRNVSPGMVTHWIKGGRLVLDGKLVDVEKSDAALAATMDPARGGRGGRSDRSADPAPRGSKSEADVAPSNAFTTHRAIRESFKAKDAELDYLQRSGELVLRRDYDRAVIDSMAPVTAALDALAPRVARKVAGETDVRKIEAAIEEEVATIRSDTAKALRVLLSEPDKVRQ